MKKIAILIAKILGVLLILVLLTGYFSYRYISNNYMDFEGDYIEQLDFSEKTIDGYTFLDRNRNGKLDPYEDAREPIDIRVTDVLSQMTQEEKIHLLKGSGFASAVGMGEPGRGIPGAVGTIVPTPRLGLPTIYLSDGPAGLRILPTREGEEQTYYCTAFPIATLLASSWNKALLYDVGNAMGNEALEYGIDVILGPGANLHRHPLCGRNFEYYSEDPFLSGHMGAAIVNGIESNGVGTSVKHYVVNNQETDRNINNAIVSERALREIYLKGFEIIVKESQPWTIMSSYNQVNGTFTSESKYLLTDVLREDWGYEGLVMTDWFGGRDAVAQICAGNDLLEPGTKKQWDALREAAKDGRLSSEAIDRAASRILQLILCSKKMQNYAYSDHPDLKAHAAVTRQSASEGMVLLKNKGALPLRERRNVALLGSTSYKFIAGGTGSGDVSEAYVVSLEEGLNNAGFEINEKAKHLFEAHKAAHPESFVEQNSFEAILNPIVPPEMNYTSEQLREIAESSDVGVLTIGRNSGEGGDRVEKDDFLLTAAEQAMIKAACRAYQTIGKKLILVLNIGGVIETASWKDQPDAILLAWQGGQEGGNSVADILSGKVNPSGKLPMTFPQHLDDHWANANFPLEGGQMGLTDLFSFILFKPDIKPEDEQIANRDYTLYKEGIYVGYRHFDKAKIEVSYPFGYGLSYTNFEYGPIEASIESDTINLFFTIKNVGKVAGKEVVQIYTEKLETTIDRPVQELKAFEKTTSIAPGALDSMQIQIPLQDLSYWNEKINNWSLEKGTYVIRVGSSSRDIRQELKIEVDSSIK